MLNVLGSRKPFAGGMNRREAMRIGGLAGLSLGLPELLQLQSLQASDKPAGSGFGGAKQILMIYLQGAATHLETWDPKPEAPEEIRGKFGATETAVPGTFICDRLPRLAKLADRMAFVRSMTHEHNNHSNLYTLTGYPAVNFSDETNPENSTHHPFFGSVLDYLEDRRAAGPPRADDFGEAVVHSSHTTGQAPRQDQPASPAPEVPRNIGLPWKFSSFSPVFRRAGPYGAFLGHAYDPVWTEFDGEATTEVSRNSFFQRKAVTVKDPFLGITPASRLRISKEARLRPEMTLDRLNRRRSLLDQFEDETRRLDATRAGEDVDRFRQMAYSLMTSSKLQRALDLDEEPTSLREKYGMTLFGQSALTARRLLEAGCRLVSVYWDEYVIVNTAWDTHSNHFTRLGDELLPGLDAGLSALLSDLEARGLLEETLVMCLTEHGRTPRVKNFTKDGGRDHWSNAYSVMLAGAGIKGGTVVGSSDSQGGFVKDRPVSPEDILATMYHAGGIDPETTIPDRLGRPVRLVDTGHVVPELLA